MLALAFASALVALAPSTAVPSSDGCRYRVRMREYPRPLLIIDGDCGFCRSSADWLEGGLRVPARVLPWQALSERDLRGLGLTVDQVQAAAWWVDESGHPSGGHRAIGRSLAASTGWRRMVAAFVLARPLTPVMAGAYRLVARHRHRLPGATPACDATSEDRRPLPSRDLRPQGEARHPAP
jgi:predicted DCC family thiol-disulfide oxidoreductase YuxK